MRLRRTSNVRQNRMKLAHFVFIVFTSVASAQEIPMIDENHAFPDGLVSASIYRLDDLVLVETCMDGKWAVQISTNSIKSKFTDYAKLGSVGGGSIIDLFSGDYNKDGKKELMACLCNGGRSGSGANQTQVIFFIFENDKIKLRATAWIEDFDPSKGSEYFRKSKIVSGPNDVNALLENPTEPNQALEPTTMAVTPRVQSRTRRASHGRGSS